MFPDYDRGTGRTTRQMKRAKEGSIYIWLSSSLDYPKQLAQKNLRPDLEIVDSSWLTYERWRGRRFSDIILDHACKLTVEERTPHLCHTCIHAEWKTTPSGRRNFNVSGKCTYPLPKLPKLPSSVEPIMFHRISIWKDYGWECPTWSDTYIFSQEESENLKINLLREGDPLDD